jgi:hypothetical protein
MKKKIKEHIKRFREHIRKISKNYRWEVRFNNLNKKYEEALLEIEKLNNKINTDEKLLIIADKDRSILRYKRIIETLRKDNKELRERK